MTVSCKSPKQVKSDEAGEDSWCVWNHYVIVVELEAVQHPGGGGEEGGHSQREGQALHITTAYDVYQVCEWGQVHADGDHTAGEAKLIEPNVSLRKKYGKVEPSADQHRPSRKGLGHHNSLLFCVANIHNDVKDLE